MIRLFPRAGLALAALLVLGFLPIPAQAQLPTELGGAVYQFELKPEADSRVDVPLNGQALLPLIFRDASKDGPAGIAPGTPTNQLSYHQVTFQVRPHVEDPGWTVFSPPSLVSYGGTTTRIEVPFQVTAQATTILYAVDIIGTITTNEGGRFFANTTLIGYSLGAKSFAAQVGGSFQVKPNQIFEAPIRLINLGLASRAFDMEVTDNPCGLTVATQNGNLVKGKSEETYLVSIETPDDKLWYFSELCTITLQVYPSGDPTVVNQVFIGVQVNGGYVDPVWVFWLVVAILCIILLLLLIARRKARIEEEILGKPQKPWTIPVEVLYLKALRQKDERAWYVVRHHLMEEEYRSSLLWYHSYKKATKGSRKKEALVLRQEKAYERWKASWLKRIAQPTKQADRFEAKLQRKLDRKAAKQERKLARKVRKITRKMAAAHAKQVERALEKWQKQVKKADKKGLAAPPRPVIPEPDYPEEPEVEATLLADHKWSKKAARFRARRVREQGDLEVKFEKADARHLAKLRRKVQRLARKLDDPTFVNEHPLLKADA